MAPGGTTRTDVNRRLGEVLKEIILIRKEMEDDRRRPGGGGGSRVGGSSGPTDVSALALEATQLLTAKETTLAAAAASLVAIDTNTDPFGGKIIANWLLDIDADTNQIRINTNQQGGLTIAEWLEDIEADVDGIESRLDTLNVNTAGLVVDLRALVAGLAVDVLSVAAQVILDVARNSKLDDIETVTNLTAQRLTFGGDSAAKLLSQIDSDTSSIRASADEIEDAIEKIEAVAGYWAGMSLGVAITAGHITLTKIIGEGTLSVFETDNVKYAESAFPGLENVHWELVPVKPFRIHNSTFQMSANANARTLTVDQLNSSHSGIRVMRFHSTTSLTDRWAGNDDDRFTTLYGPTTHSMDWLFNGILAASEETVHSASVDVWMPAV